MTNQPTLTNEELITRIDDLRHLVTEWIDSVRERIDNVVDRQAALDKTTESHVKNEIYFLQRDIDTLKNDISSLERNSK